MIAPLSRWLPDRVLVFVADSSLATFHLLDQMSIETRRQGNDLAIARSIPLLFGLFSSVTLMANALGNGAKSPIGTAAGAPTETDGQ